jgi:CO/xanthine dehydrogenase Mo-binding subunit
LAKAVTTLEAVYETPYLAHATMEPQNCTAHVTTDSCEVWAPTQGPQLAREVAARVTGLAHDKITVHQTYLGGGFGRRIAQDYVEEAVRISKSLGLPVQVLWSREDDMRNDYYRPCAVTKLRAGLDAEGELVAWKARLASQSIVSTMAPDFVANMLPTWTPRFLKNASGSAASRLLKVLVDDTAVEGASTLPYGIPNLRVEFTRQDPGVPIGFWRSVGHSFNVFVSESFLDECAHAAKKNPLAFRQDLLANQPRLRAVLDLAAQKADWDKPLPQGVYRGIAVAESFKSYVAHVVEASVVDNAIVVRRVVSAVDCGFVVNPDIVVAQVEGSVVFALSAALKQRITIEKGQVVQGNFHDYECLRMMECPRIEVHLVPSAEEPTGIGEPAVPPVAPALAGAVFMATGKRLRSLPLQLTEAGLR